MADISEEQLEKEIAEILKNAELKNTSTKKVIQQLEEKLGVSLAEKKKLIDKMVMDYVNNMESDEEEEAESEASEESEEEVKPKKKPAKAPKRKIKKEESDDDDDDDDKAHDDDDDDDDEDDSRDKDWGNSKKRRKGDDKKKAAPKSKKGGGKRKGSGYTRAYKLSPALAELMGAEEMPRHEVVKRVWAIIKEKQLYDPNNRQFAICDKALYKVIGTQRFRTFGMMKYLKSHFLDD